MFIKPYYVLIVCIFIMMCSSNHTPWRLFAYSSCCVYQTTLCVDWLPIHHVVFIKSSSVKIVCIFIMVLLYVIWENVKNGQINTFESWVLSMYIKSSSVIIVCMFIMYQALWWLVAYSSWYVHQTTLMIGCIFIRVCASNHTNDWLNIHQGVCIKPHSNDWLHIHQGVCIKPHSNDWLYIHHCDHVFIKPHSVMIGCILIMMCSSNHTPWRLFAYSSWCAYQTTSVKIVCIFIRMCSSNYTLRRLFAYSSCCVHQTTLCEDCLHIHHDVLIKSSSVKIVCIFIMMCSSSQALWRLFVYSSWCAHQTVLCDYSAIWTVCWLFLS